MANIYVLATANLTSPWTRQSSYDGRYLRCHSTSLSTGGNSTHTHNTVNSTSGSTSVNLKPSPAGGMNQHTHNVSPVATSASNNDPVYYTLSLWYMNSTTWETTVGCFQANTVVLSNNSISVSGFSRFTSADNKFIVLGNPGSSGGRTTHTDHTFTATLDSMTPPNGGQASGCSWGAANNVTHSHTWSAASVPSADLQPARAKTRLYYTTTETDSAPAGIVCFFDGAPSAKWTSLSWNDRYIMSADTNPTLEGSNSHGHSATGGTSTDFSTPWNCTGSSGCCVVTVNHNHTVSIECGSSDHSPLYVTLTPYYLNTTIYPPKGASAVLQLSARCIGAFTK